VYQCVSNMQKKEREREREREREGDREGERETERERERDRERRVGCSQESNAEHKQQTRLPERRDGHGQDDGNRQYKYHKVSDDVDVGQGPPDVVRVTVAVGDGGIPHLGERDAHAEVHGQSPDVVDDHDAKGDVDGLARVVVRLQGAEIEEENGHLGEPEAQVIEQGHDVRSLSLKSEHRCQYFFFLFFFFFFSFCLRLGELGLEHIHEDTP